MSFQIIPYRSPLAREFREMNLNWLNAYFHVEPKDVELLDKAEETIIEKGGKIFFAELDREIVGCFSLLPYSQECFELGKMAVKPGYQGRKIGNRLLTFAIEYAKSQGKESLVLYSNTVLSPAIHLYKKFGFIEVDMEHPPPYARSNIKMSLKL